MRDIRLAQGLAGRLPKLSPHERETAAHLLAKAGSWTWVDRLIVRRLITPRAPLSRTLDDRDVIEIRTSGLSDRVLAARFGCAISTIAAARIGRTHADLDAVAPPFRRAQQQEDDPLRRLGDAQVAGLREPGRVVSALARNFGISRQAAQAARNGWSYAHLNERFPPLQQSRRGRRRGA